ncbi:MAG: transporter [Proteobacteria bacterium]|nr:transporter [Pseudomonadota bacterium]
MLLSLIQTFQVFDTIAVLTNGGPNGATDVLLYKIQRDSFVSLKVGYGSALTVVFLILLGLFAIAQGLASRKREG